MDNPQHYQPLSHALHPPQNAYVTPGIYTNQKSSTAPTQREEEEEEEEDGDDEGMVEEQLSRNEPDGGSSPSSPQTKPTSTTATPAQQTQQHQDDPDSQEPDRKRRPGRPRGSKNRKPRVGQAAKQEGGAAFYHPVAGVTPPQHPDVNAHNQQYYEFQWRVLNLCAEFYGAAEELVKGTPPLVIAQCYQMGPSNKVDPLVMLGEAKRICDTLLANPSQLISSPPPPIYSMPPNLYQAPPPVASTSSISTRASTAAPTTKPSATASAPVITNPQSFVVSLGPHQTGYPHAQYSMYAPPPPAGYPANPYYQYPSYPGAATYYSPQPQPPPPQPTQTQVPSQAQSQTQAVTHEAPGTGNQGAWSDEETERLKKLAEDSRSVGSSGDIEWDWVVHQWGAGRTRHQILIKATALGLKESSSRGVKRRREAEASDGASPSVPPTPTVPPTTTTANATSTSAKTMPAPSTSPSHTPAASPALQHQQRPPPAQSSGSSSSVASNKPASAASTTSSLPWPMPTVAVSTPSPVITVGATQQQQEPQRTSYYRARPSTGDAAGGKTHHPYMYQPNGSVTGQGQGRLAQAKENGSAT